MTAPSALVRALAGAIAPLAPIEAGDGDAAIRRDDDLLAGLLASQATPSHIRLWTNSQCLVTPRTMASKPGFAEAQAAALAAGWPVRLRESGGTTVVHRPGILNVSLLFAVAADQAVIEAAYGRLADRILPALAVLKVADADVGAVPGSYCDGRFNIRIGGRKLAGTACRIRRTTGRAAVLAHASIVVEGDPASDLAAITAFETGIGLAADYRLDSLCTLAGAMEARGISFPAR